MKSGRLLLIAAILCFCISLFPQSNPNTDVGMKPYDSFHGGTLDSVSMTSGNLFFHHTEYALPQRGEAELTFSLQYNNKGFRMQTTCNARGPFRYPTTNNPNSGGATGCTPTYTVLWNGSGVNLIDDQTLNVSGQNTDTGQQNGNGSEVYTWVYSAKTSDGSMHPLGYTGSDYRALDASGIRWDGNSFVTAQTRSGMYQTFAGTVVDSNGNYTSTDGSNNWIDTLGRVIPLVPGPTTSTQTPPASTASLSSCPNLNLAYQPVTYAYQWNPPGPTGTSPFILCFASVYIRTGNVNDQYYRDLSLSVNMLQSLVRPDGTAWTFTYDGANPNDTTSIAYGDLLKIGFPTGGSISYTYATETMYQGQWISGMLTTWSRSVVSRTVDANDGTGPHTWSYNWVSNIVSNTGSSYVAENTVNDPLGNDTVHQVTGLFGGPSLFESQTRYYQGSQNSGTLLKTVNTDYNYSISPFDSLGPNVNPPTAINVVPIRVTTILSNGLTTKEEKDYDSGFSFHDPFWGLTVYPPISSASNMHSGTLGTVSARREYDYGSGAAGNLLRQTFTTYLWQGSGNYLTANMLDLPSSVVVKDGNGNRVAETDSTYDESNYFTNSGISTQHGAPLNAVRGNPNTISRWLNTGGAVVTHTNWYDTGEVYQVLDALGNATTHSYDPAYDGAYSTKTCNALNQCVSGTYDFNSGLLTSFTDANGSPASGNTQGDPAHSSNYSYDNMFRLTQALSPPDPNGQLPETDFYYLNATTVERQRKFDNNNTWIRDYAYFDGLGRTIRTRLADPEGDDYVDTTYDAMGRVSTVSNPHRSSSSQTDGTTTTYYDTLGRVTQTTKQDGSFSLVKYDLQTGNANCALATDETGKPRYACSDALGRLVEVQEPSAASVFTPGWSRVLQQWGAPGDIPVPGDYDGDGITDFAIWRPSTGDWWVMRSSDGTIVTQQWGNEASGDVPVPGDYDGDGKTDLAIWRASTGTWWILRSSDGGTMTQQWGNQASGDVPVPGDYDGDRRTDFAVWRASTGTWYVLRSSDGGTTTQQLGNQASGDTPVPGDYDGDKKTDFAVWRSSTGTWYVLRSSDGGTTTQSWGLSGDKPAQGDYDGDGKTDFAVWRPSTATWWLIRSSDGHEVSEQWGTNGDMPVAASFQGGGQADFAVWNPTTGMWSASLSYVTLYSYDALGNLISVNQQGDGSQGARVRTFTYDSLSRLLTANNPESGTISYSYDANGNVLQKTSPAPNQTQSTVTQTISYCYDKLNRVTGKQYAAATCPLSLPVVSYGYDAGTNGIGHLSSLADQAGSGSYSFDALGRITSEQRTIAGIQKSLSYTYFLDSSINTLAYPSGAVLTYSYNTASGQTAARVGTVVDSSNSISINYVTGTGGPGSYAMHAPDGSVTSYVNGYSASFNGIANSLSYNTRLQPITMSATTPNNQTVFSLTYDFHLGNGDNGNVYAIANNRDSSRNQTFTYDALNRLASARNAGNDCSRKTANKLYEYWGNTYSYDPWGNLTHKTVMQGVTPPTCGGESMDAPASASNQLTGYGYDAAGNMTYDGTYHVNYSFDQENRITGGGQYTYIYDADGNRVEKSNGSTGTIYWYMSPGIVGESDLSGNLQSEYVFFDGERVARKDFPGGAVSYYFSDHLRTASVITDSAENIKEDEDFYPWGGELQFLNNDSNHYKFTGKERDSETGLDYFGARYYGNWLGRFISADWAAKPEAVPYADLGDPQSLNLYSYVRNIPATKTDADGHQCAICPFDYVVPLAQAVGETENLVADVGTDVLKFAFTQWQPHMLQTLPSPQGSCICPTTENQNQNSDSSKNNNNNSFQQNNEQGRDAQGKFTSKQPGQTQPGAAAEKEALDSVGAVKNTEKLNGTIRDGTIPETGQHVEAKSGAAVNNTQQLQNMGQAAKDATGQPLKVVTTNPNVKVSGPAQRNQNLQIEPVKKDNQ